MPPVGQGLAGFPAALMSTDSTSQPWVPAGAAVNGTALTQLPRVSSTRRSRLAGEVGLGASRTMRKVAPRSQSCTTISRSCHRSGLPVRAAGPSAEPHTRPIRSMLLSATAAMNSRTAASALGSGWGVAGPE